MYRLQWFECPTPQIFNLETLSWVASWNIDEILIDSVNIHGLKVCRKLVYYVNPHSEQILELGTRNFPYKSINMVMLEIFDFISGTNNEVTVRLSSAAEHEFLHGGSFLYNLKKIIFEPYNVNIKNITVGVQEYGV